MRFDTAALLLSALAAASPALAGGGTWGERARTHWPLNKADSQNSVQYGCLDGETIRAGPVGEVRSGPETWVATFSGRRHPRGDAGVVVVVTAAERHSLEAPLSGKGWEEKRRAAREAAGILHWDLRELADKRVEVHRAYAAAEKMDGVWKEKTAQWVGEVARAYGVPAEDVVFQPATFEPASVSVAPDGEVRALEVGRVEKGGS